MLISELPAANGIKVGRFILKPHNVNAELTKSCRMVLLESKTPGLPMARRGTATLLRHAGQDYVFLTRHQLELKPGQVPNNEILEMVRISSGHEKLANIGLQACIYETTNPEEVFHDILAFKVAPTWKTEAADRPYFYPLTPFFKGDRVTSFLTGYPTASNNMENYYETFKPEGVGSIGMTRAITDCELDVGHTSAAGYLNRYTLKKDIGSLDGYSGGAVFSMTGSVGEHTIVFDGLVVMGGGTQQGKVHIINADALIQMLDSNHHE